MVTGVEKYACCQPEAVSEANVADASLVPVELHRLPTWVPVLAVLFQNRTPVTVPPTSEVNFTPSSTEDASPESPFVGVAELDQMVQALHVTGAGVTLFEAVEAGLVPTEFVAVTLNVYAVPLVRPLTVADVCGGLPLTVVAVCAVDPTYGVTV